MKILLSFFTAFFFFCMNLAGQENWSAGVFFNPSFSGLYEKKQHIYDPLFSVNTAIKVNYLYHKFYFTTGFLHLTQGYQWTGWVSTTDIPEGGMGYYTQKIKVKGIFVSENANYIFLNTKKIIFYSGIGMYVGYIYSQKFYPIYMNPVHYRIINTFYLGANVGIGIKYYIKPDINIVFAPSFLYQLREKQPNIIFNTKLYSLSFDIGFEYSFGKKTVSKTE